MSKPQSFKDYPLDSRNSTTKKSKNKLPTHAHSTNQYHQKYEGSLEDQLTNKKQIITAKQIKMMIRCCGLYCYQSESEQNQLRYKISTRLLSYLRNNFKVVGSQKQIQQYERLLNQITPPAERRCPDCEELGRVCDQYQLQIIESQLQKDLQRLQVELAGKMEIHEMYEQALKSKKTSKQKAEELEKLKKAYFLQTQILKHLDPDLREESPSHPNKIRNQALIEQEDS